MSRKPTGPKPRKSKPSPPPPTGIPGATPSHPYGPDRHPDGRALHEPDDADDEFIPDFFLDDLVERGDRLRQEGSPALPTAEQNAEIDRLYGFKDGPDLDPEAARKLAASKDALRAGFRIPEILRDRPLDKPEHDSDMW